jgi:hypothetical protein
MNWIVSVGQVANLRRIANPPLRRRDSIPPQVGNLTHMFISGLAAGW